MAPKFSIKSILEGKKCRKVPFLEGRTLSYCFADLLQNSCENPGIQLPHWVFLSFSKKTWGSKARSRAEIAYSPIILVTSRCRRQQTVTSHWIAADSHAWGLFIGSVAGFLDGGDYGNLDYLPLKPMMDLNCWDGWNKPSNEFFKCWLIQWQNEHSHWF